MARSRRRGLEDYKGALRACAATTVGPNSGTASGLGIELLDLEHE